MDALVNSSNTTRNATNNTAPQSFTSMNLRNVLLVFGIIIVLLNLLALTGLAKCKRMNIQIRILAINLVFTDLLIGINQLLMYTTLLMSATNNMILCVITLYTYRIVFNQNLLLIACLALDRLICLYFTMGYAQYVTKKFIIMSTALTWLFNILYTIVSFIGNGAEEHAFCFIVKRFYGIEYNCALIITCFIIVCIACGGIFLNIRRHVKNMKVSGIVSSGKIKMQFMYTVKVMVIALAFFLTYIPICSHIILVTLWPDLLWKTLAFYYISGFICLTNSIINPILYALRFKECRLEMITVLCFWNNKIATLIAQKQKKLHAAFLETSSVNPISSHDSKNEKIQQISTIDRKSSKDISTELSKLTNKKGHVSLKEGSYQQSD